jgi:hypothetical protein
MGCSAQVGQNGSYEVSSLRYLQVAPSGQEQLKSHRNCFKQQAWKEHIAPFPGDGKQQSRYCQQLTLTMLATARGIDTPQTLYQHHEKS